MPRLDLMSEEERTEFYSRVSEMAGEGLCIAEIARALGSTGWKIKSICDDFEIPLKKKKTSVRMLTKSEIKDYRKERLRNTPITELAIRFGVDVKFLHKLDTYLKVRAECRYCHALVKHRNKRYCASCILRRRSEIVMACNSRRRLEDPEYRAKNAALSRAYQRRKRLTAAPGPGNM